MAQPMLSRFISKARASAGVPSPLNASGAPPAAPGNTGIMPPHMQQGPMGAPLGGGVMGGQPPAPGNTGIVPPHMQGGALGTMQPMGQQVGPGPGLGQGLGQGAKMANFLQAFRNNPRFAQMRQRFIPGAPM